MKLEMTDLKGDDWGLMMPGAPDKRQPNTWWCPVLSGPDALRHYAEIPVPVSV